MGGEYGARDRKKIQIVHLLGGGHFCGAGQYAIRIMEGLEGRDFQFTLFSLKEGPLAAEAKRRGLSVHVLGKTRTADPWSVLKVARFLRSEGIDLVHTHTSNSNFYGIPASLLSPRCRPIVTLHAYYKDVHADAFSTQTLLRAGYKLDLFLVGKACRVISVSKSIKDRIVHDGVSPERIMVIPNGIDFLAYQSQADRESVRKELRVKQTSLLVGTVGRLAWVKNQELFLRAAARALSEEDNLRFILFGDGPEEERLKRLSADLGIGSQVHFAGYRNDIARCLSALDIFVLSSRSEVAPYVLLESMALGIPVISTNVGGVSEIVEPGETGLLTESGNIGEMVEAILLLARDRRVRETLGSQGRTLVEHRFSEASMLRATAGCYASAFRDG